MYANPSLRPTDGAIVTGAAVAYVSLLATARVVLAQVPPAAGFHLDPGLVGLLSAIIGGVFTLIGTWMVVRRRDVPNVTTLLVKIADLEEQLAQRPSPPHRRSRRPHEEE